MNAKGRGEDASVSLDQYLFLGLEVLESFMNGCQSGIGSGSSSRCCFGFGIGRVVAVCICR